MTDNPQKLKVFLCHASENIPVVQGLYYRLSAAGFDPWLDSHYLLPGMDWGLEIQKAMRSSDTVIVCLSKISVAKEGYVQKEIKHAQEIQKEKPEGTIFLIPLQLEECEIPYSLREIQWGEYFEQDGFEKLVKALNIRATQLKRIPGVAAAPVNKGLPPGSYIPFLRNALFTGREEDLEKLASILISSSLLSSNEIPLGGGGNEIIILAITGMGGIGKTQLAVEFAYRYGHLFRGVHWLDLRNLDELDNSIARCGEQMGLIFGSEKEQAGHALITWKADGPRLLILDNFEEVTKMGKVLSRFQSLTIRLLITSRRTDFPEWAGLQIQKLDLFSEAESLEFLSKKLKRKESEFAKKSLAEELGYLPLAIELATSYININKLEIREYLHEIENILSHESMKEDWFKDLDITNPTEHDQSLLATFQLSWQEVKDETARKIFCFAGRFPKKTQIPFSYLRKTLEIDIKTALKSVDRLQKLNLLISSDDAIGIHPLLASFARIIAKNLFPDDIGKILTGSIEEPTITEAVGVNPTSIIRTDSAWHIQLDWSLEGSLVSWIPSLGQSWVVRAFLESIGPGRDYNIPEDFGIAAPTLDLNAGILDSTVPNKLNYSLSIDVDPTVVYPATPQLVDAGIYKLVVSVTSVEKTTGKPGSFAGFFEGKTLQFYDA